MKKKLTAKPTTKKRPLFPEMDKVKVINKLNPAELVACAAAMGTKKFSFSDLLKCSKYMDCFVHYKLGKSMAYISNRTGVSESTMERLFAEFKTFN